MRFFWNPRGPDSTRSAINLDARWRASHRDPCRASGAGCRCQNAGSARPSPSQSTTAQVGAPPAESRSFTGTVRMPIGKPAPARLAVTLADMGSWGAEPNPDRTRTQPPPFGSAAANHTRGLANITPANDGQDFRQNVHKGLINASNTCSNTGMETSVIDPFPVSQRRALADARRLDDQDLCDAIHDAEMAPLRRHQAHTAVLTAGTELPDPGDGYFAQRRRENWPPCWRFPAQRRPPMDTAVGL